MEEQNKTTESGQAAADLDRSLGGPDPYTSHHEGRHRVEDCITRDIHDYRHYLETIQLKDSGK